MAQNFIACDREQPFLLPPDVRDWLPEDHFAWFVIDAVGVMDTRVLWRLSRGRPRPRGLRAVDDDRAVAVLLVARCALVATHRARAHRGRRVSSHRRAAAARSRDDRAVH